MLKLKRIKQEIHIRYRHKDRIFNRPFLYALLLALSIHLLALLLFRIHKMEGEEIVLPPISVNALIHQEVMAQIEPTNSLEPRFTEPMLPSIPPIKLDYPEPLYDTQNLACLHPLFILPNPSTGITIHISGPLSKMICLHNELPEERLKAQFLYTVQVDNATGKVFWYYSTDPHPFAEKILNTIQFLPETDGFITKGEIEIQCYLS